MTTSGPHHSYRRLSKELKALPWIMAAPSFVRPAGVAENCRFLDKMVDEVALLFLETRACLEYGPEDLPPDLAGLDLTYHVHLPLDLPWDLGPEAVWRAVDGLAEKAAFLSPGSFVLHPPVLETNRTDLPALKDLAARWEAAGRDPGLIILENTEQSDLMDILTPARDMGLGLCLDLGHLLAYNQTSLLRAAPWDMVAMLHLSAPGPRGEHLPLAMLDASGEDALGAMLRKVDEKTVVNLELFNEDAFTASADRLIRLAKRWGLAQDRGHAS